MQQLNILKINTFTLRHLTSGLIKIWFLLMVSCVKTHFSLFISFFIKPENSGSFEIEGQMLMNSGVVHFCVDTERPKRGGGPENQ